VAGVQTSNESTEEEPLDIQAIVKELKRERDRLNKAIVALEETDSFPTPRMSSPATTPRMLSPATNLPAPQSKRGRRLTPEGRKRLSDNMKKRWAEKKKKAVRGRK
jgi:hypothetical protein